MNGPVIEENKWGYIKIKFKNKIFEYGKKIGERADVIIWYNGLVKWNWKNKLTLSNGHNPGVSKKAVQYLEKKGCKIIIISKGYDNVLQTDKDVINYLKNNKITVYHLNSENAAKKWNELIKKDKKVGILFHSTC
jgi:hypothetical protein